MPGQKNSGNKKIKRESGVGIRHKRLISNLLEDIRNEGKVDDVYIGRVIKKLGNGRISVFFVKTELEDTFDKEGNEIQKEVHKSYEKQVLIPGRFRGRGKHSVWIEVGGIVVIGDSGVEILEVIATLTKEELEKISKNMFIDDRIMNYTISDGTGTTNQTNDGIEFAEDISDGDIDNI
jgi:hypothetical protein